MLATWPSQRPDTKTLPASHMLSMTRSEGGETLPAHKWVSYICGTCEGLTEAPTSTEEVAEVLCGLAFGGQRFGHCTFGPQLV